jgi:hypothetical protein
MSEPTTRELIDRLDRVADTKSARMDLEYPILEQLAANRLRRLSRHASAWEALANKRQDRIKELEYQLTELEGPEQ